MSAPVDVLAVMEAAIKRTSPTTHFNERANMWAAHDAIAELIEAARSFDKTYAWHWDRVDGAAVIMPERVDEFEKRASRLAAALAAVGVQHG